MRRLRGSTSQRRFIFIADTSDSTGAGLANLTHNSAGLVGYYIAGDLNNEVQITLVTATLGTFASGGFVAVDNANMPGWYEVGIPDAALDGGNQVAIQYRGATNMAPVNIYIELDAVDYQDAAAFGLSRIDQTIGSRAAQTSLPANFSSLGISPTGVILTVGMVEELASGALTANGAGEAIPSYVWGALLASHTTANTFGARVVRSLGSNNTVQITASHHAAAVLHDAEPNSIPEDAFQNGAVSARVIAADAIDGDAMASSALTEIANAVGAPSAAVIADAVWDEILVGHLGAGTTGEALNNSGGSGNPWITDIATGYSGTQAGNVLNQVKAKTDLITSGNVQTSIPVTAQGQITGPLYIGDDYLTANGRQFDWTIALPTGFVAATSTCKFGMMFEDESGVSEFLVSGTVADVGSGNVRLRFELPRATTGALKPGFHRWSTEIVSATGVEVTAVAYSDRKLVEWREKQT